jgi:hypothetical protein
VAPLELPRVPANVLFNERLDEVIAVVVARVHAQLEELP